MNEKTKQIIIAVVVIVVAFIGFKVFMGKDSADTSLTTDSSTTKFVDGQAVLVLLNRLNKVTLNESIFSSAAFTSLQSFEVPIPDQVIARPNPFAPIGSDGSTTIIAPVSTSSRAR